MNKQIHRVVRQLNCMQRGGAELTVSSVTRRLFDSKHSVEEIQDILLVLFKQYVSRKQVCRIIRRHTK